MGPLPNSSVCIANLTGIPTPKLYCKCCFAKAASLSGFALIIDSGARAWVSVQAERSEFIEEPGGTRRTGSQKIRRAKAVLLPESGRYAEPAGLGDRRRNDGGD